MAELRAVLAVVLVLLVPGAVLTYALFRDVWLDLAARVAISLGLSVATAMLIGLGLAVAGVPLGPGPWFLAMVAATATGLGLWFLGRRGTSSSPSMTRDWGHAGWQPAARRRIDAGVVLRLAAFGLAGILAIGGLVVAGRARLEQQYPPYTAFWLVQDGSSLQVGATSEEDSEVGFRVVVSSASGVLKEWPAIALVPGQTWTDTIPLPASPAGLAADLYRAGETTAYRHVDWPAAGPSPSGSVAPSPSTSPTSSPTPSASP